MGQKRMTVYASEIRVGDKVAFDSVNDVKSHNDGVTRHQKKEIVAVEHRYNHFWNLMVLLTTEEWVDSRQAVVKVTRTYSGSDRCLIIRQT